MSKTQYAVVKMVDADKLDKLSDNPEWSETVERIEYFDSKENARQWMLEEYPDRIFSGVWNRIPFGNTSELGRVLITDFELTLK